MKKLSISSMSAAALIAAVGMGAPAADAALITLNDAATEGLTYTLEEAATANPLTEKFALVITGENTAADTRFTGLPGNGRTGINAIAFNLESNQGNNPSPASGQMDATLINNVLVNPATAGWQFKPGGLSSGGCDSNGAFFCFDNLGIPPIPTGLVTGPVVLVFEATLLPGHSWANYTTDLKIDWVGSANNYSLVSEAITVNTTCPDCSPTPFSAVPEPGSLMLLGSALAALGGLGGVRGALGWWRRRDDEDDDSNTLAA